ncbi:Uncharacterised protein [Legionella donaldsonii]|uniref:Uncharacterized protein n=1 Tax=Legionella donaldsonii TaxID=45060 RepID=A0A378J5D9_9GAMM|nr:hypothetical protein [Legionella donaldsonii]STX42963.1 Uncharacterised protein [Legionella donaldsonii]
MTSKGIQASDIIPDGADFAQINGVQVRKGSVGAFLANINLLENSSTTKEKEDALHVLQELAPTIIAIGLQKHVTFKNKQVEDLLQQAKKI